MRKDYSQSRIEDALEQSGGDLGKAQRMVLSWIENDQTLLAGLVAPHIKAIIAHAVSHAAKPRPASKIDVSAEPPSDFGRELLEGLAGAAGAPRFGEAEVSQGFRDPQPLAASQKHIDAIHALAGKKGDQKKQ